MKPAAPVTRTGSAGGADISQAPIGQVPRHAGRIEHGFHVHHQAAVPEASPEFIARPVEIGPVRHRQHQRVELAEGVERGEVDFSYTYGARVKAQPKLAFSFEQNLNGLEYLTVLKNAPNKANAVKFVQFALRPDRQAALMTALGYTPVSRKAVSLVSEDTRKWFPNLENPNSIILNDNFWAERFDVVGRRFKEWVLA